jgi:putative transposase
MARPLRIEYGGAIYHVTSRGNDKKAIYRDDADRKSFLDILDRVNKKYNWYCHAYCLMNNHYHLLIETPDGNLSAGMRQLNGVYTQSFNHRHQRVGHIFQGRFKAVLIQKDSHLLEVCRYVVLNPVRAKAIKKPEEWQWSSYKGTAGPASPHSALTNQWILGQFSDRMATARSSYIEFVNAGIGEKTIWDGVKGQILLGEKEFIEQFGEVLKDHEKISELPKGQRYANRPELKEVLAEKFLRDKVKRAERIKLAVVHHGYSQREIADYLGMHFSSISRILREYDEMTTK